VEKKIIHGQTKRERERETNESHKNSKLLVPLLTPFAFLFYLYANESTLPVGFVCVCVLKCPSV